MNALDGTLSATRMPGAAEADAPAGVAGRSPTHESARAHVTGHARFIDDLPVPLGTLHAAPVLSPIAHGRLLGIDTAAALAMPGVVAVLTVSDIPGDRHFATPAHDEPILADGEVLHVGQVVALVVADSHRRAREAATRVRCEIEPLPAILTIEQALQAQSQVLPTVRFRRGDADAAIAASLHRLEGAFEVGGQEHFYLEGQIALALPQENHGWTVHSSTQHPGEAQHWIAHALDLPLHAVQVVCRRMGGGFGGKETQAGHLAVWATLAALRTGRPVKMRLDRDDDFMVTGKRHNFLYRYTAGFDDQGVLAGLRLLMASQCGFSADLSGPVNDRAVFHVDNTYFLADVDIESIRCLTHTQSSTAFRGFGGPQGMFAIETILGDIARHLGLDALDVRERNLYGPAPRDVTHYGMRLEDNIAPQLIAKLAADSRYRERRAGIAAWNAAHPLVKRGLALTPVKFGISFTATHFNQAGALVSVYTDGSVRVNHGGTEMGQGLNTKMAQVAADGLGIPVSLVRVTATDTQKVPNASATAASSGADINGAAINNACDQLRERLSAVAARMLGCPAADVVFQGGQALGGGKAVSWQALIKQAWLDRVGLGVTGFYMTPDIAYDFQTLKGRAFYYFCYGAAVSEMEIDTLTGEWWLKAVDIVHDVGRSINPAIDRGQIEGAYVQGMGWLTMEECIWDKKGKLLTHGPST